MTDASIQPSSTEWWVVALDSIYLLDTGAQTITRVCGTRPPTPRQGPDGTPRKFVRLLHSDWIATVDTIKVPTPGREFVVEWGGAEPYTRIATVVAVSDRAAWGGSYWLRDPTQTPGGTGAVMAAGHPVLVSPTVTGALAIAALLTIASHGMLSATAVGVASASMADGPGNWTTEEPDELTFAAVGDGGWRRPWDIPAPE